MSGKKDKNEVDRNCFEICAENEHFTYAINLLEDVLQDEGDSKAVVARQTLRSNELKQCLHCSAVKLKSLDLGRSYGKKIKRDQNMNWTRQATIFQLD